MMQPIFPWHPPFTVTFYISIIIDQFCQVKFNAKKNSNKKRKGLLHRAKDWKVSFDLKIKLFSTLGSEDIQDQLCRWGNSESHKQAQGRHTLSPEKTLSFHLKLISRLRGSPATWWRSAPAGPIHKDWQRFFFGFLCKCFFGGLFTYFSSWHSRKSLSKWAEYELMKQRLQWSHTTRNSTKVIWKSLKTKGQYSVQQ